MPYVIRTQDRRINWANLLTISRLVLLPIGIAVYLAAGQLVGFLVLAVSAGTDYFDGRVARRLNLVSDFGAQLDPVIDKLFMISLVVLAFAELPAKYRLTVEFVFVIEVLILLLSAYAKSRGITVKVSRMGKRSMFARMTGMVWLLLSPAFGKSAGNVVGFLAAEVCAIGALFGALALAGYITQVWPGKA